MPLKDPEQRKAYHRQYNKEWYQKNKDAHRARCNQRATELRVSHRAKVNRLKESTPCADCGQHFPAVCMDFDHLSDKREGVSVLVAQALAWEVIEAEIAKCEVVCSNCHRLRTVARLDPGSSNREDATL